MQRPCVDQSWVEQHQRFTRAVLLVPGLHSIEFDDFCHAASFRSVGCRTPPMTASQCVDLFSIGADAGGLCGR